MKRPVTRGVAFTATSAFILAAAYCAAVPKTFGQAAPAAPAPAAAAADEEVIELDPFTVSAQDEKDGYIAKETLAGSRVRTDLKDLGSSISVVTKQLLQDVGATNNQTLLQYTNNTEVGGLRGNFGGMGNTGNQDEAGRLLRPDNSTRVRGLDNADNTRDYFLTDTPWDGYNVDRVELQRGPNSILFGLGSPAGIINTSLATASFKNAGKFETRFSKYGSIRNILDVNYAPIDNQLAFRVIGLDDRTKYQQKPAFNHDKRVFAALRVEPKFLNSDSAHTTLRVNFEDGNVRANRPRQLPPVDGITPWFSSLNKGTYDPAVVERSGGIAEPSSATYNAYFRDAFLGRAFNSSIASFYDANSAAVLQSVPSTNAVYGPVVDGVRQTSVSIGGLPFFRPMGIAPYSTWSRYQSDATLPGGPKGIYVDKSLTDTSVFDFFNKLIDGPTKREWQNFRSYDVSLAQTFFNNRLGIEGVYNHQNYDDGQVSLLNAGNYIIGVDCNSTSITGSTQVGGTPNPYAGYAFVGNDGQYGNNASFIERESKRLTVTGDVRASDFLGRTTLSSILGRHVFTGLLSEDSKKTETRQWVRFATAAGAGSYTDLIGGSTKINDGDRMINSISYLGNLNGRSNAHGANLSAITANVIPSGTVTTKYFDTTWIRPTDPLATGYIDPQAAWTNPLTGVTDNPEKEKDNPANYAGWKTQTFQVLNADNGDIDQLYYDGSKLSNLIESRAITYQGYLWDNNLVATLGYRRDKVSQQSASAPKNSLGVSQMGYSVNPEKTFTTGESKSWSVVLHTPKELRKYLPGNTDISLFYNSSQNFKADTVRVDVLGNLIPNQSGRTKDYGFTVTTLDDKLSLKVNWYETSVKNATLQGANLGLGGNLYYLWQGEIWGIMDAAQAIAGLEHRPERTDAWTWDWASKNPPYGVSTPYDAWPRDPASATVDAAELAAAKSWLSQIPDQKFFDNYGYPINVAEIKAGNFSSLMTNAGQLHMVWDWQALYGGRIKSSGTAPVATGDTTSKGVEFELVAQPTKNWNITINVAKTDATRQNLSKTLEAYILATKVRYDSIGGDLRLWGPDSATIRTNWYQSIYYPYTFVKSQEGASASEIRPWRANIITNYSFDTGALKGFNVGGAVRYQQADILGYGVSKDTAGNWNMDVTKPLKGKSETLFDLWVGYQRKLTTKLDWRIQLNLQSVGKSTRLLPITLQPDGSAGAYRIADGMGWQLTNTFSF